MNRAWREAGEAAYRMVMEDGMDPEAIAAALARQGYEGWTAQRVARSVEARYRYREGRRLSWALALPAPMTRVSEESE